MAKEQEHNSKAERAARAREAMARKKAAAAAALAAEQEVEKEKQPAEITERDIIEAAIKSKDFNPVVETIEDTPEEITVEIIAPEAVQPQIISPNKDIEIVPGKAGMKWSARIGKKTVRGTEEKVKHFLKANGVEYL